MSSNPLDAVRLNFSQGDLLLLNLALALIMLMGQYTGYKLSELRRFRAMVDNDETAKNNEPSKGAGA